MNDVAVALLVPAALIGLNYLARDPRAQGRGWRVSRMLTRFGVMAAVVGFVVFMAFTEFHDLFPHWDGGLKRSSPLTVFVALVGGVSLLLYVTGLLATLASLLLRLWLRFDAYLRKVGPKNFARNVGHLTWTAGKSGIKLYAMALAAFAALHLVGLRNLAFLGLLKGVLNDGSGARDSTNNARRGAETTAVPEPRRPPEPGIY